MTQGEKGQVTLDHVRSKILASYPSAQLSRTTMSLRLESILRTTASLEFIIETGDFFTVVLNGHSIELTLSPEECISVFEAVLHGCCRQVITRKGQRVVKVLTEIELRDQKVRYVRGTFGIAIGITRVEEVQFEPYPFIKVGPRRTRSNED